MVPKLKNLRKLCEYRETNRGMEPAVATADAGGGI